jgi:DNA modification methylase
MRLTALSEVGIAANRQRREFDEEELSTLAEDIALNGLLHPIVVRETVEGLVLVSGERRIRALSSLHEYAIPIRFDNKTLPLDRIPTVTLGELTPLEAREAEWSENFHRANLTWQEAAIAQAELHDLRTQQAQANGQIQTLTQTVTELIGYKPEGGKEAAQLRETITITKHLADPEVAQAASPKEALKVIEKKLTKEHNEKLATAMGQIAISSRHRLVQGEAIKEMASLPRESFDVILTDPPYGMGAQNFGTQAENIHEYDDSETTWVNLMTMLAPRSFDLAKPQAHAYVFCDPDRFHELKELFALAGWNCWRTPLIWTKSTGMLPRPEHGPRRQYEFILFANKGDRRTTAIYSDVLQYTSDHSSLHPAQKPVELFANLLARSVRPGDSVLDPFAGSGTIFPAANRHSCKAVAIEMNAGYCGAALKRMEEK